MLRCVIFWHKLEAKIDSKEFDVGFIRLCRQAAANKAGKTTAKWSRALNQWKKSLLLKLYFEFWPGNTYRMLANTDPNYPTYSTCFKLISIRISQKFIHYKLRKKEKNASRFILNSKIYNYCVFSKVKKDQNGFYSISSLSLLWINLIKKTVTAIKNLGVN